MMQHHKKQTSSFLFSCGGRSILVLVTLFGVFGLLLLSQMIHVEDDVLRSSSWVPYREQQNDYHFYHTNAIKSNETYRKTLEIQPQELKQIMKNITKNMPAMIKSLGIQVKLSRKSSQ